MGKFRVKLVCMDGGGISPGSEKTHFLPDHTADTYIIQNSEGAFNLCDDSGEIDWETVDVLARLEKRKFKAAVTESSYES